MLGTLSDTKRAVIETIRMRLKTKEALLYLERVGYPMAQRTYFKHKHDLESRKLERLHSIAFERFEDQHLECIDTLETILRLMWENYHKCTNPKDAVYILDKIKELLPFLSTYYETTRRVLETGHALGNSGERSQSIQRETTTAETDEPRVE